MTTPNHTPAPWYNVENSYIHANYPNQNGPHIATVWAHGDRQTAANARLIAAAPELLAALKRMDALHSLMMKRADHGACFWDAETITEMNEAPLQAAAAIAKAEDGR